MRLKDRFFIIILFTILIRLNDMMLRLIVKARYHRHTIYAPTLASQF